MDQRPKILLVEDEAVTRATLNHFLVRNGFEVKGADTAAAAYALLVAEAFALVLLDINLPDMDGLSLAAEIRKSFDTAIVFITQRNERATRIEALETTGDDYITKPLDLRELLARLRSVLRRRGGGGADKVSIGGIDVDLDRREVRLAGCGRIDLTRGEFDLLAALIRANGNVVTRQVLASVVTRQLGPSDMRTVDTLVSRLRRKLGAELGDEIPDLLGR
jgi:two-component system torCAD operon response regulator TorR